jgi:hypothetical protein
LLLPLIVQAQSVTSGSLTVTSSPSGAEAVLEGEADVSGVTPVAFTYALIGEYRLVIRKHGFEEYKTRLVLNPAQPQQINVDLSPKTGTKAALRSVVVPGWGQYYGDQKTKSFMFGVLFSGALLYFIGAEDDFQGKQDEYLRRLDEYDRALDAGGTFADLSSRHRQMVAAQQEAYDAENDRRVAIAAVAVIWGLNVLDALLFTPDQRATFSVKGLTVTPTAGSNGVALTLTKAF